MTSYRSHPLDYAAHTLNKGTRASATYFAVWMAHIHLKSFKGCKTRPHQERFEKCAWLDIFGLTTQFGGSRMLKGAHFFAGIPKVCPEDNVFYDVFMYMCLWALQG